jgi:spore germination protein KB
MNRVTISNVQTYMLGISSLTVTGHLLFIPAIINHAGRDSWLSVITALFPALSIRGFGEFFTTAITPRTPILVYFSAIIILAVYAVRSGLEVLARTNAMFLLTMIPIGIVASILTHKDKDYRNFLPILEYGPEPMLLGALREAGIRLPKTIGSGRSSLYPPPRSPPSRHRLTAWRSLRA